MERYMHATKLLEPICSGVQHLGVRAIIYAFIILLIPQVLATSYSIRSDSPQQVSEEDKRYRAL